MIPGAKDDADLVVTEGLSGIEEANGGRHCLAWWVIAFFYALSHFNFVEARSVCFTNTSPSFGDNVCLPLSRGDSPYLHNPHERGL